MLKEFNIEKFDEIYKIMKFSFPFDELRSYEGQKDLLNQKEYKILTIENSEEIEAFASVWEFEKYLHLEHFAVSPQYRNKGLGCTILEELSKYSNKQIILEVEHPTDEQSKKRIEFYKRNGFHLFDFNYVMPAYTPAHKPVPFLLMSKEEISQELYEYFYQKIVHVVNKK